MPRRGGPSSITQLDRLLDGDLSPPASAGQSLEEIETPALVVDLDAFEFNLEAMAHYAKAHDIALWPHAKTHKTPEIARRQFDVGAADICAQTVGEAVPFVGAGLSPILISNQVVGSAKIDLLCRLAARSNERLRRRCCQYRGARRGRPWIWNDARGARQPSSANRTGLPSAADRSAAKVTRCVSKAVSISASGIGWPVFRLSTKAWNSAS